MSPVIIYTENIEALRALVHSLKSSLKVNSLSFYRIHLLPESSPKKEDKFINDVYNDRHLSHLVLTTRHKAYGKQFDISGIYIRTPPKKKAKLIFVPKNTLPLFIRLEKVKSFQDLAIIEANHQINKAFLPLNSIISKPEVLSGVNQLMIPSTALKSILALNTCSLWYFMKYIIYRVFIPKVEAIDRRDTTQKKLIPRSTYYWRPFVKKWKEGFMHFLWRSRSR